MPVSGGSDIGAELVSLSLIQKNVTDLFVKLRKKKNESEDYNKINMMPSNMDK